ncbi:MAG: AAA family ATPase [Candidatus Absconditabacterales bacterium]
MHSFYCEFLSTMQVKKIDTTTQQKYKNEHRPISFGDFVGQEDSVRVIKTAISSSQKGGHPLGHMLLLGPAGYGKTTLAQIIAHELGAHCKVVTAYAINKPADIISLLNTLQEGDILFIDEIHRLIPKIEEMLYTAMEDFVIDMVMPDGGHVRIPIQPFTLIGATTKSDSLSKPLKSRFIYRFHFVDYTDTEKQRIVGYYLKKLGMSFEPLDIARFSRILENVPRELHNGCVRMFDYLTAHHQHLTLSAAIIDQFTDRNKAQEGGLTPLHQAYLDVLQGAGKPLGLKTIAIKMGLHEKTVEEEIEPLLIKMGLVDKVTNGRVIN